MHFASMRSKRDDMRRVTCAYFIQNAFKEEDPQNP